MQPLSDILPLMAGREVNQLPVMQHGTLVGVVSRDAIVHSLEVRRSLGVENAKSDSHNQQSRAAQRTTGEAGPSCATCPETTSKAHDIRRHSMRKAKGEQEVRR
jgi:hypothetical protein